MYNKIYERKEFMIFKVKNGYIVYNAKKSFQEGHTHLKHFEAAKTAIDLVIRKKIPRSTHSYYLTSLIRISEDDSYINKIKELINSREQKGKKYKYYNSRNKSWKRSISSFLFYYCLVKDLFDFGEELISIYSFLDTK